MLRIRGEFEPDWSAVVKNLHEPIFALDSNGKIIVWNLGAEKLFGYPDQEMPSVSADKKRFKQILLNFLSNAFKYNRVGGQGVARMPDCR